MLDDKLFAEAFVIGRLRTREISVNYREVIRCWWCYAFGLHMYEVVQCLCGMRRGMRVVELLSSKVLYYRSIGLATAARQ